MGSLTRPALDRDEQRDALRVELLVTEELDLFGPFFPLSDDSICTVEK